MPSSLPVVRQIAWLSVVPQVALLLLFTAVAGRLGIRSPFVAGAFAYLVLSLILRRLIPRAHREGMRLFKLERFGEAVPQFKKSYDFFSRYPWIDHWRFVTLLSSSRISYREMALLNVAFCLGQVGQPEAAISEYNRVLREFPGSKLAEAALRMLKPDAQRST